jgi:hypothetical protein
MGSTSLLQSTHHEFAETVCRNLSTVEYQPFLADHRKLRVLVLQLYEFVAPGGSAGARVIVDAEQVRSRAEEVFTKTPVVELADALERLPHCGPR